MHLAPSSHCCVPGAMPHLPTVGWQVKVSQLDSVSGDAGMGLTYLTWCRLQSLEIQLSFSCLMAMRIAVWQGRPLGAEIAILA